jgi:hypothetical protein
MNFKISKFFCLELAVAVLLFAPAAKAQQAGADVVLRGNSSSLKAEVRNGADLRATVLGNGHYLVMGAEGRGTRGNVFVGPCDRPQPPAFVDFHDSGRLAIRVVPCF